MQETLIGESLNPGMLDVKGYPVPVVVAWRAWAVSPFSFSPRMLDAKSYLVPLVIGHCVASTGQRVAESRVSSPQSRSPSVRHNAYRYFWP